MLFLLFINTYLHKFWNIYGDLIIINCNLSSNEVSYINYRNIWNIWGIYVLEAVILENYQNNIKK